MRNHGWSLDCGFNTILRERNLGRLRGLSRREEIKTGKILFLFV